ncbi:MAG: ATP-binding protein [Acetobacteraceae bacterium]
MRTLTAALATIEEAIGIYDADDRLVAFNAHYADWRSAIGGDVTYGARWDDLVQASIQRGAIPEAIGREDQWLEQRRRTRGSYSIIRRLADGRAFKVNERRMSDGGIAVVWTDITDLLKADDARTEAIGRDEQHLQTMGHLTAGVAHDFNNLLTAVMGNLALLRRHLPSADARTARLLGNAELGADRCAALIERLLSFSRRKPQEEAGAVDLRPLIAGMSDLLRSAVGAAIEVQTRFPPEALAVYADPGQLEVAILNLVINARDAMDRDGHLTIALRAEPRGSDASSMTDYVVLSIIDTGTGMDEATLARATEPLFTTKSAGAGTGLGLSMVQNLAVRSGGRFVLHSTLGIGTTAELWLPSANDGTVQSTGCD